jgi:hypothetical protein
MSIIEKQDNDHNNNHDNGGATAPAAPAGGAPTSLASMLASTSLTQLAATFSRVDTSAYHGRTGLPSLLFRAKEPQPWGIGKARIVPDGDGRWVADIASFAWGYICFPPRDKSKPVERMVPVSQPKPLVTQLPDLGGEWQEQWTVNLTCVSGVDAGTAVIHKGSTDGCLQAIAGLFDTIRDRINAGEHDVVVPILQLGQDSYPHSQYGRTVIPLLTIIGWMSRHDQRPTSPPSSPAPAPATPAAEQQPPRRRRVA